MAIGRSEPQGSVTTLARPQADLAPGFGRLLKQWRRHRRCSQLTLALETGISQRHISFLETGRAQPSRRTVLDLAESLELPLRERNVLLQRAGFAAMYSDEPLASADMGLFRTALDQLLAKHEPYPAMIVDGRWNLIGSNTGALKLFSQFVDLTEVLAPADGAASSFPMVRLCMAEDGMRPFIENWDEVMYTFLQRARHALLANPMDQQVQALIDFLQSHPDAPERWRTPSWNDAPVPALGLRLRRGEQRYALFSMMAHFGAPQQVAAQELSVELFFPADQHTEQALQELV